MFSCLLNLFEWFVGSSLVSFWGVFVGKALGCQQALGSRKCVPLLKMCQANASYL